MFVLSWGTFCITAGEHIIYIKPIIKDFEKLERSTETGDPDVSDRKDHVLHCVISLISFIVYYSFKAGNCFCLHVFLVSLCCLAEVSS